MATSIAVACMVLVGRAAIGHGYSYGTVTTPMATVFAGARRLLRHALVLLVMDVAKVLCERV